MLAIRHPDFLRMEGPMLRLSALKPLPRYFGTIVKSKLNQWFIRGNNQAQNTPDSKLYFVSSNLVHFPAVKKAEKGAKVSFIDPQWPKASPSPNTTDVRLAIRKKGVIVEKSQYRCFILGDDQSNDTLKGKLVFTPSGKRFPDFWKAKVGSQVSFIEAPWLSQTPNSCVVEVKLDGENNEIVESPKSAPSLVVRPATLTVEEDNGIEDLVLHDEEAGCMILIDIANLMIEGTRAWERKQVESNNDSLHSKWKVSPEKLKRLILLGGASHGVPRKCSLPRAFDSGGQNNVFAGSREVTLDLSPRSSFNLKQKQVDAKIVREIAIDMGARMCREKLQFQVPSRTYCIVSGDGDFIDVTKAALKSNAMLKFGPGNPRNHLSFIFLHIMISKVTALSKLLTLKTSSTNLKIN